jgi:leishmanolysin
MAEPFGWGYGRGCSWVNQDCDSGQWNAIGEFCQTANSVYKCTYDRKAVGECDLTTYTSNLPSYYQYFAQPTVGGSLETADFCPVIQSLQDTICQSISSTVYVEDTYGVDSRCFEVQYDGSADAGCYRHRCTSTTTVQAYVRGNWVDCPYGTTITVNGSPTLRYAIRCGFLDQPPDSRVIELSVSRLQCPSASENFCVTKLSPFAIAGTRRLDVPVYSFPPDVGSGAESGLIARVWIAVVFSVLTIALRL